MKTAQFLGDFKVEELWNKGCSKELIDKFVNVIGFEGTVTEKNFRSIFDTFENVEELIQYGFLREKKEEVTMEDCAFIESILPIFESIYGDNSDKDSECDDCSDCTCDTLSDDTSKDVTDVIEDIKKNLISGMEEVMTRVLKEGLDADDDEIVDVKIDMNDSFETLVSFKYVDKNIKEVTDFMGALLK